MQRFPPAARLTRKADLELVRHEGKRFRTTHLEVRHVASLRLEARIGIIVPRHKHSAVSRNLVKRRLRELSRRSLRPALTDVHVDVVMRAMPSAYTASFEELGIDVARIARRVGTVGSAT